MTPKPLTRAQQQERTRADLIDAAETIFARDGFHAASLDDIAAAAGYTKGAIYSNFEHKAGLYLAVLDRTFASAMDRQQSPADTIAEELALEGRTPEEVQQVARGHLLASLEFIATAIRDPQLAAQLTERIESGRRAFVELARTYASPDDPIDVEELGSFVYAVQQGIGLLSGLGGGPSPATTDAMLRRLLIPPPDP